MAPKISKHATTEELLQFVRAAGEAANRGEGCGSSLSSIAIWESAVDRLLVDARSARAGGNEPLALKAEQAATRLYLARCGEFERWREIPPRRFTQDHARAGLGEYTLRQAAGTSRQMETAIL